MMIEFAFWVYIFIEPRFIFCLFIYLIVCVCVMDSPLVKQTIDVFLAG